MRARIHLNATEPDAISYFPFSLAENLLRTTAPIIRRPVQAQFECHTHSYAYKSGQTCLFKNQPSPWILICHTADTESQANDDDDLAAGQLVFTSEDQVHSIRCLPWRL